MEHPAQTVVIVVLVEDIASTAHILQQGKG